MRVAIDYTSAIHQAAGIGRFTRSLVNALAEIDRDTEYLLVYAAPPRGVQAEIPQAPNFSGHRIPLPDRLLTIAWQRLRIPVPVDLATGPLDIFHSPDFVLPPVWRTTTVLTVHDLAFLLRPECADEKLRDYLEKAVPRSVARADFVLADSENTQDDLIVLLGVPPSKVEVIPGGVDPRFAPIGRPQAEAVRREITGGVPYILSVGMIEPRKNLVRLIDAFDRMKAAHSLPHKLVLAGKRGWLSDDIYRRAAESPNARDVIFPGFIPESALPGLYGASDLLAFPSLYEGFGLPPLEAMASGIPVVVSRSSSLPEVVGTAALMVDPESSEQLAEAMALPLLDPELRRRMVADGLLRAKRYSWQTAAERMLHVYRRLSKR